MEDAEVRKKLFLKEAKFFSFSRKNVFQCVLFHILPSDDYKQNFYSEQSKTNSQLHGITMKNRTKFTGTTIEILFKLHFKCSKVNHYTSLKHEKEIMKEN